MPILHITNSEAGGNRGSCSQLIGYLEKENAGLTPEQKEYFFAHDRDQVTADAVIDRIDSNKKKLGQQESKFYMLNIAPSQKEQEHIAALAGNDPDKLKAHLKAYTRAVMEKYAEGFGKNLSSKDLVWFAKIEEQRRYKGSDRAVQTGELRRGQQKEGLQFHVHVVISRRCAANKLKLSPLTAHRHTEHGPVRGGFDRAEFIKAGERVFDEMFAYKRSLAEKFEYAQVLKHGTAEERRAALVESYREQHQLAELQKQLAQKKEQEKSKGWGQGFGMGM